MAKTINANLSILKKDIEHALKRLVGYRLENKKKAEIVVVATATISAATTIAIGLIPLWDRGEAAFRVIALVLSTSLTVLAAWDGLYNHKRLWLLQAEIVNKLYDILDDIKHLEATGAVDQEALNELYVRYKAAFGEFNSQWREMRTERDAAASTEGD